MDCSYCSTATIEGRIIRKHDPKKLIEAIAKYTDAGLDHFFFVDNTFNLPSAYANTLCEQLISSKLKITVGIRIYPQTSLAQTAIKEGLITADDNLLFPKFYIAKGLEGWLRENVKAWMETRPHWVM